MKDRLLPQTEQSGRPQPDGQEGPRGTLQRPGCNHNVGDTCVVMLLGFPPVSQRLPPQNKLTSENGVLMRREVEHHSCPGHRHPGNGHSNQDAPYLGPEGRSTGHKAIGTTSIPTFSFSHRYSQIHSTFILAHINLLYFNNLFVFMYDPSPPILPAPQPCEEKREGYLSMSPSNIALYE